jgi:putative serine protease PepD
VVIGVVVVAIVGGVAGGLIVRETRGSGNSNDSAAANASAGACAAVKVADTALPSVVTVLASGAHQGGGTGSGVVIRSGGYILTNDHVISVAAPGGTLTVRRGDGETEGATLVGRDPLSDLAVIKADGASGPTPIAIGKSTDLQVGEPVVALGSPLGLTSTVTSGIVSALNRYVRVPSEHGHAHLVGAIQTDASINPGNSGGALVDCAGQLVGINTAGATVPNSAGGSIGLGFAIPVDLANGVAGELIANGRVSRPNFGLQVQAIPQELVQRTGGTAGLFVQNVTPGGPAERAGLQPGDIITEVDGEPATSVDPLIVKTLTSKPGQTVRLTYVHHGSTQTAQITLTESDFR